ncbi:MAG: N-formylglutamate amidohydrolase [Acidimicrobiia bacterium]
MIATAIHNGHELSPEVERIIALSEATRLREEDPFTGEIVAHFLKNVVVHRSRFEVDLNRERDNAIYRTPADAWGLDLWKQEPDDHLVSRSLALYDSFYANLKLTLDQMVEIQGGFVLYDIHSYNHRRQGPEGPPEDQNGNPTVNLGTGTLPGRWRQVADSFLEAMRSQELDGERIDTRENVRFDGGGLAAFVHHEYGDLGCALAVELKKVFMDEWTGELYPDTHRQLGQALLATVDPVVTAWSSSVGK